MTEPVPGPVPDSATAHGPAPRGRLLLAGAGLLAGFLVAFALPASWVFLADAKTVNPRLRIIGLTATPYRLKSGMICTPDGILNQICYEVGVRQLIVDGYLSRLVSKAGKEKARFESIHVRGGEFVADEMQSVMDDDRLVTAADPPALAPLLSARLRGDEVVVLKASRGVALERILPALTARPNPLG